jgi:hypothetical protein
MKCPLCNCESFFVKNPDDEYDIYEFTCSNGETTFETDAGEDDVPQISDATETYCNKCVWHGKMDTIKS